MASDNSPHVLPPFVPYEAKTSLLHISGYENQNLRGSWFNFCFEQERPFYSTTELLLQIEEHLDQLHFPQKAMNERFFRQPAAVRPFAAAQVPAPVKYLASFKINVLFRQNASWQGSLVWLEQNAEAQFRSVLELIKLIDSALEQEK